MRSFASLISFAAILCCVSNAARATVFTASNGAGLAARAEFTVVGSNLTVLLTNTSSSDVLVPAQILTAVFFNGNGILTPSSAVLPSGSTVFFDPQGQPSGGIVGGEWAYSGSVSNSSINGMGRGIGSAGFGIFGAANFPGQNLDGNPPVQGLSYGITSAGDNTNTGNTPVTGGTNNNPVPLIKNSVLFTLAITPNSGFTLSSIDRVRFQYGTALNEGHLLSPPPTSGPPIVPEPASIAVFGLIGLMAGMRKFRNNRKAGSK